MAAPLDIDDVADMLVGLAAAAAQDPRVTPAAALAIVGHCRALRDVVADALRPASHPTDAGLDGLAAQARMQGGPDGRFVPT